jgi:hypothetical protein
MHRRAWILGVKPSPMLTSGDTDATALFLYDATATAALLLGSSPRTTATDVTPYPSFLLMPPHSSIEVPGPPDRGTQPIGVSGGVVVVDKYDRIQGG